jgi:hypothetical protein
LTFKYTVHFLWNTKLKERHRLFDSDLILLKSIERDSNHRALLRPLDTGCPHSTGFSANTRARISMAVFNDQWLLGLGLLFFISSCVALAINKQRRDAVFRRLHFQRRRASGASTPPRSFSPSKKPAVATSGNPDYSTTFPPSRREVLPELAKTLSATNAKILLKSEPPVDFLLKNPLPMTQSYAIGSDVPKYTPTGFSTTEIKAMGDFPAYDILTGTPLPQAYQNFDPAKALPRPYRPFRWAYHQTMCTFHQYFYNPPADEYSLCQNGTRLVAGG